jgi:hypothetical protein
MTTLASYESLFTIAVAAPLGSSRLLRREVDRAVGADGLFGRQAFLPACQRSRQRGLEAAVDPE